MNEDGPLVEVVPEPLLGPDGRPGGRERPLVRGLLVPEREIARKAAAKLSLQAKSYASKFPNIVIQNN